MDSKIFGIDLNTLTQNNFAVKDYIDSVDETDIN